MKTLERILFLLLCLMMLSSIFGYVMGITGSIQHTSSYLFEYEIEAIKLILQGEMSGAALVLTLLMFAAHLVILSLPFLQNKNYFFKLLIWAPMIGISSILAYVLLINPVLFFLVFALLPFVLFWIGTLVAASVIQRKTYLVHRIEEGSIN